MKVVKTALLTREHLIILAAHYLRSLIAEKLGVSTAEVHVAFRIEERMLLPDVHFAESVTLPTPQLLEVSKGLWDTEVGPRLRVWLRDCRAPWAHFHRGEDGEETRAQAN